MSCKALSSKRRCQSVCKGRMDAPHASATRTPQAHWANGRCACSIYAGFIEDFVPKKDISITKPCHLLQFRQ